MNVFSLFKNTKERLNDRLNFAQFFEEGVTKEIINSSDTMMLFFTTDHGWIGGNELFFTTFGFVDIYDFRNRYESIREIFLRESEEIFTQDDKSWLDYIKKHKKEGYRVVISSQEQIAHLKVTCHTLHTNKDFYVVALQDITALHVSEEKAQEVENLKTKFLSNIGHEFRTPMNAILGFSELLEQTVLDKQQTEYLNMIKYSSKNLMVNIETLLDLSQMQGGRLQLENCDFSLLDEMESVSYHFSQICKEKDISVMAFIDPKLPKIIYSDPKKITQIMMALMQNAMKFTDRGGRIIVEVKLLQRQPGGECNVGFSVKDNGHGLSSEQIALINEPFTASNYADERLGVGLSLANGLVKLFASELKIQSENDNGSYFNFVLHFKASQGQAYKMVPKKRVKVLLLNKNKIDEASFLTIYLRSFSIDVIKANVIDETIYDDAEALYIVADQNDASWMLKLGTFHKKIPVILLLEESEKLQAKLTPLVDATIKKPLLASSIAKHLQNMYHEKHSPHEEVTKVKLKESIRALVVEDNLINQRLIQILLREYNIAVVTASNGNEAVNMCKKHTFDIVFMDIDMPEKNGILATQEIKAIINFNGKTPIVALTAMAMQGDKEMLLREGLDDYISKPLTREKLEKILQKYLNSLSTVVSN